jgi:uncharacterized membrane protein YqjE
MATSRTSSKVKGLLASVIELVQVRFQLLTIEAREEAMRLLGMIAFGAIAIYLLSMSLVFFALLVVAHYWDTPHRLAAVFGVGLGFVVLGGLSALLAWSRFKQGTQLFFQQPQRAAR